MRARGNLADPLLAGAAPFPLAHAGHWLVNLLYLVPVVLISIALWRSTRREDREREEDEPRAE